MRTHRAAFPANSSTSAVKYSKTAARYTVKKPRFSTDAMELKDRIELDLMNPLRYVEQNDLCEDDVRYVLLGKQVQLELYKEESGKIEESVRVAKRSNDDDDSLFQVDSLSSQLISRCGECRSKILSSVVGKELII